jgi:aquaporin Z
VLGALAAAWVAQGMTGRTFAPAPAADASTAAAVGVELLFTFALALVVLSTATASKTTGNSYFGLAIGFTVMVGAFAGGPISGGAFNPAVGIGPILVDTFAGAGSIRHLWIYLVGPLAGGLLAAAVFRMQEGSA